MKFFYIINFGLFLFYCTKSQNSQIKYPGGPEPGDEPILFAKGSVSVDGKNTHACTFSPDGRILVFSRNPDKN
jgi:hypothetical protein